jgi:hypothetical protein
VSKRWNSESDAKRPRLALGAQRECAVLIRRAREGSVQHRALLARFPAIGHLDDHALDEIAGWATSLQTAECQRRGISTEIPHGVVRLIEFVRGVVLRGASLPTLPMGGSTKQGPQGPSPIDEEDGEFEVLTEPAPPSQEGPDETPAMSLGVRGQGSAEVDTSALARMCVTWKDDFAGTTILNSRGDLCDADARRGWQSLAQLRGVDLEGSIAGRLSLNVGLPVALVCRVPTTRGATPATEALRDCSGYLDLDHGVFIRLFPVPLERFIPTGAEDVVFANVGDYVAIPIEDVLLNDLRRSFRRVDLSPLFDCDPGPVEARIDAHFRKMTRTDVSMATLARWRDTLFKLVLRAGGRSLEGMMICGQTYGHVASGRYYYAARTASLSELALQALARVAGPQSSAEQRAPLPSDHSFVKPYVGSRLHLEDTEARRLVNMLRQRVGSISPKCRSVSEVRAFHNRFIPWCAQFCCGVSGHRLETMLKDVRLWHFDCVSQQLYIRDKGQPRVAILNHLQVKQLSALYRHLVRTADLLKEAAPQAAQALQAAAEGRGPLFIVLDADLQPQPLNAGKLLEGLSLTIPANWTRHRLYTALMAAGVSMTVIDAVFGHVEAGFHALGARSTASLPDVQRAVMKVLDELIEKDGWEVIRGLGPAEGNFWDQSTPAPIDTMVTRVLREKLLGLTAKRTPASIAREKARRQHRDSAMLLVRNVAVTVLTAEVVEETGVTVTADQGSALRNGVLADSPTGPLREARLLALRGFLRKRIKHHAWHVHLPDFHLPVEVEPSPMIEEACRARAEVLAWRELLAVDLQLDDEQREPASRVRRWLGIMLLGAVLTNHVTRRLELRLILQQLKLAKEFPAPFSLAAIAVFPGIPEPGRALHPAGDNPGVESGALFVSGQTAIAVSRIQGDPLVTQELLDESAASLDEVIASVVPRQYRKGRRASEVVDYFLALAWANMRYEVPGVVTAIHDGRLRHGGFSIEQWQHLISGLPVSHCKQSVDSDKTVPLFASLAHLRPQAPPPVADVDEQYKQLVRIVHIKPGRPKALIWDRNEKAIEPHEFRAKLAPGLEREVLSFLEHKGARLAPIVLALAAWVLELLRIGTPREPELVVRTIHNKVTLVGSRLVKAIPTVDLLSAPADALAVVYEEIVRAGDRKEARLISEVAAFHAALVRAFGVEPITIDDFTEEAEPEVIRPSAVSPRRIDDICFLLAQDASSPDRIRQVSPHLARLLQRSGARLLEILLRPNADVSFDEGLLRIVATSYWGVKSHNSPRLMHLQNMTARERMDGEAWSMAERKVASGDWSQSLVFAERPGLSAVIDPQLICERLRAAIKAVSGDQAASLRNFRHTSISFHVLACFPSADYLWSRGVRTEDLLGTPDRKTAEEFRRAFAGDGAVGRGGIAQTAAAHGNQSARSLVSYTHIALLVRALCVSDALGDASMANTTSTGGSNIRKLRHELREKGVIEDDLPLRMCARLYAVAPLQPLSGPAMHGPLECLPPTRLAEHRLDNLRMVHELLVDCAAGLPIENLGRRYRLSAEAVRAVINRANVLAERLPLAGYAVCAASETKAATGGGGERAVSADFQASTVLAAADRPFDEWSQGLHQAFTCLADALRLHFDVRHQCVASDDVAVVRNVIGALEAIGLARCSIRIERHTVNLPTDERTAIDALAADVGVEADQVSLVERKRVAIGAMTDVLELQLGHGQALKALCVWRRALLYCAYRSQQHVR